MFAAKYQEGSFENLITKNVIDDECKFQNYFRLTKCQFNFVLSAIANDIFKAPTHKFASSSLEKLIFLIFIMVKNNKIDYKLLRQEIIIYYDALTANYWSLDTCERCRNKTSSYENNGKQSATGAACSHCCSQLQKLNHTFSPLFCIR